MKNKALARIFGYEHDELLGKPSRILYKDENLRKELILKGRQIAKQYDWDKTAVLLWQSIEKAVH